MRHLYSMFGKCSSKKIIVSNNFITYPAQRRANIHFIIARTRIEKQNHFSYSHRELHLPDN